MLTPYSAAVIFEDVQGKRITSSFEPVTVYERNADGTDGALAEIFADIDGNEPLMNPANADKKGVLTFYAQGGNYNWSARGESVPLATNILDVEKDGKTRYRRDGQWVEGIEDATAPDNPVPLAQADGRFVNTTGDTMTGELGVEQATADSNAVNLGQLFQIIQSPAPDDDWGFVTQPITEFLDYGSVI